MKPYREVIYGHRNNLQENFDACVQEMEAAGLNDDELEELISEVLVPEIAKLFAETYQGSWSLPPEDALAEYCRREGISESLYDAIHDFIAEAVADDEDNIETDWTKLSRAEHIAAVKRFLKKLASTTPSASKPFFPTNAKTSAAAKTLGPVANDNLKNNDNNKLRPARLPVVGEETSSSHTKHPLHSLLKSHGYEHHRTYPIKQRDASVKTYRIWANKFSNLVGAYDGERRWTSKVNKNSGHQVSGNGRAELDAHLKNRAARNKNLPEQRSLPANPLQEGLQNPYGKEKVKQYSEWMKRNPFRTLDHDVATTDVASRKNDLLTAWRLRAEQDRVYGFDEDTDYHAASLAQLNERKKKDD